MYLRYTLIVFKLTQIAQEVIFCETGSDMVKPEVKFLSPEIASMSHSMCF